MEAEVPAVILTMPTAAQPEGSSLPNSGSAPVCTVSPNGPPSGISHFWKIQSLLPRLLESPLVWIVLSPHFPRGTGYNFT